MIPTTSASEAPAKKQKTAKSFSSSSSGGTKGFYPRKEVKAAAPKFKRVYKESSPELQSLIDQVIDPDSASDAIRWPQTYGLSAVYKSINTIDARFDANGQSCVVVYPRLVNSVLVTAGESYGQPLVAAGNAAQNYLIQKVTLDETHPSTYVTDLWMFENDHAVLPAPISVPGRMLYPFYWLSSDTTPVVNFQVTTLTTGDVSALKMTTRWYDATGTETHNSVAYFNDDGLVTQALNPVVATQTTSYLSFELALNGIPGYDGILTSQFREVGASPLFTIVLSDVANHFIVHDLNGASTICNSAEMYFVLAQSLLCTYTGSDLNNGGLIATARVPGDTVLGEKSDQGASSPQGNPYYNWVASLSNNRYDGPVKQGSYSFYLGQDEQDYFYRRVEDSISQDAPYLVSAFSTTDTGGVNLLRIKVITWVQFTTNNNIYSLQPSPYMRDVSMLHHVLSFVPSSYCNPLHKSAVKAHLKKIGQRIGQVVTNPDNWMSAAKIAAKLLL